MWGTSSAAPGRQASETSGDGTMAPPPAAAAAAAPDLALAATAPSFSGPTLRLGATTSVNEEMPESWAEAARQASGTSEPRPQSASAAWASTTRASWDWNGSPWAWNQQAGAPAPHYKGDFSDPPAWPGWSYRKQWFQSIKRWNKQTDIPVFRRAEKVLRTLGWELQSNFEHLSEEQLASPAYLDKILAVLEMKAGVREDEDKRQAYPGIMHENQRKRDESLAQYAMRRTRDFTKASSHGVVLPSQFKVAMMREGAGLSEQGQQNLTALLQGRDDDVDHLAAILARMDVRAHKISSCMHASEEAVRDCLHRQRQ